MTDQLEAIRKRHEAIIPGPWRWYGNPEANQVYLATTTRGRLIILTPSTRREEYVHDHLTTETYTLEEARERATAYWCPAHGVAADPDDRGECQCDEMRRFMSGEIDATEGTRYFDHEGRGYRIDLTRYVQTYDDLSFPEPPQEGWTDEARQRRNKHGGRVLKATRDLPVRYEVLDYRTVTEWERDQGGVVPNLDMNIDHHLYRKDFTGIDTPEADFIQYAPEDVGYLLDLVRELQAQVIERDAQLAEMRKTGPWGES